MEGPLAQAWFTLSTGTTGPFRVTNWLTYLLKSFEDRYDVVFVDVGPSLGAINRTVLLSCGYFITPLGADVYSLIGVRNISGWMGEWAKQYKKHYADALESNRDSFESYGLIDSTLSRHGYIGYTRQQYITKSTAGIRRATVAYEQILSSIPDVVSQYLSSFVDDDLSASDLDLGDVPHLFSLIPLAQRAAAPIIALRSGDGLVGSQHRQAQQYALIIDRLAAHIEMNMQMVTYDEL